MTLLATLTNYADIALLAIIVFTFYDALRQVRPRRDPIRAVSFACITIGGFGWIMYDLHEAPVPWWALLFHIGVAGHAVIRFIVRNRPELQRYVVLFRFHP